MLKHVLVPLDGSELAEEALKYAQEIVAPNGRITLLSAVDVPTLPVYGYYVPEAMANYEKVVNDMLPQANTYLEKVADRLRTETLTVGVEAQIGDPADVIAATAERMGVDAIVMSTHGRSGINRWLFGSVTNKVLGAKPCPVFVIPSQNSHHTD